MKLKSVLILSINVLFAGIYVADSSAASTNTTNEKLSLQLSQEKGKVKSLEAEIIKLRGTISKLKSAPSSQDKYTIKEGETITQIANRHGISRKTLMKINGITENQQIYIGDKLMIPAAPTPPAPEVNLVKNAVTPPAPTPTPKPVTVSKKVLAKAPTPKSPPSPSPKKASSIAWTKTEQSEKNEKTQPKSPTKTLATKTKPEKEKTPKTPPVVVAKVEPKPAAVTPPTPKKETPVKDVATLETKPNDLGFTYYTIKFGDNLGKIAKKHGISVGALMNFNGLTNPDKISGGQKLKIPSKEKAKALSKIKSITKPVTPAVVASSDGKPLPGDDYGVYVVQSGDTLYELARDFFTTEKEIQSLNKMGSKTNIAPGQDLIVPTAEYFKKADLANN